MERALPPLPEVPRSKFHDLGPLPSLVIKTEHDVEKWSTTRSYCEYDLFLRRLSESVVGIMQTSFEEAPSQVKHDYNHLNLSLTWSMQSIVKILALLDTLEGWIEEIPPLRTPQRFGNLAFRTWGSRLEERADELLECLLGSGMKVLLPYVKPYFLTSFGSFTRMDYGTGHETSFALLLLCLTLARFFQPTLEEERHLVLCVFVRYLRLCWRLQDVYKLEPAGSHGVWGLDDYCFLPYVFGSGQLRDQSDIPPSAVLHPPLPSTNLYFLAITRIHNVKRGPFFEHSSQLYSIATGVPTWAKVNSGLFKMYRAEVLGKRVVVQHIPLGGLLEWETLTADQSSPSSTPSQVSQQTMAVNARTTDSPSQNSSSAHPGGTT
ncbi:Serine/threonine-protein phosphatase 2A activator 1 [Leucoagaricus sp. SymC.cos]|nr:Serine/threonine-protein phosphatase 2A activator 1 [Leucoagaricus sp. SymC.cos]